MNFRTTIVLGAVCVALLVFVLVDSLVGGKKKPPGEQTVDLKGRKLLDQKRDDVTRFILRSAGGAVVELTRTGEEWKLTSPVNWAASSWEAGRMVDEVLDLRLRGQVELTKDNLSGTGLDKPRYTVELVTKAGKTSKVEIGARSAVGSDLYIRSGGTAYLANAGKLADTLDKPVDKLVATLRDGKLFAQSASDVKQFEVQRKNEKIVLQKTGDQWQMLSPQKIAADTTEVEDFIRIVTNLRADNFIDNDAAELAAAKFDKPQVTVWFSSQAPATQPSTAPASRPAGVTVAIGQFEDVLKEKVYVKVDDPASASKVSMSAETLAKLEKTIGALDLRDRKVIDIDPKNVSSLTLTTNLMATTQPTTRSASKESITIERKKVSAVLGPALPVTKPATTGPATAATAPATARVEYEPTEWEITAPRKGDALESKVKSLLDALHPLKAKKYLDPSGPATKPVATYVLVIKTQSAGGAQSGTYELSLTDPGDSKPLIGDFAGLRFEADRDIVSKLEGDWANKPK